MANGRVLFKSAEAGGQNDAGMISVPYSVSCFQRQKPFAPRRVAFPVEIFRSLRSGDVEWVETAGNLDAAFERAKPLAALDPERYFLFDRETARFIDPTEPPVARDGPSNSDHTRRAELAVTAHRKQSD